MPHTIIGDTTPLITPDSIQQGYMDTCAVKCQEIILHNFGINCTEDQLVTEAMQHGWFNNGTPVADVGKLLETHGIDIRTFDDANQYTLINELAQGHQVIVGVDSGELWNDGLSDKLMDFLGINGADHAIIVNGIDASDPANLLITITDPGSGEVTQYPYEQFADAWQDSHCHMVATTTAPGDFTPFSSEFQDTLLCAFNG